MTRSDPVGSPSEAGTVYVSITGLRLRAVWHYPAFLRHALLSMAQAQRAPGNIRAEARRIDGVYHTLSVWTDRDAMRTYLASGAHLEAMRAFRRIATGKTCGFVTATPPDWSDVPHLYRELGKTT